MKYIFYFMSLFLIVSCIDDKTNLNYEYINYLDGKVSGIDSKYTLFPGESVTITPTVRLALDTINPDLSYLWLVDGVEVGTDATYTFTAEKMGDYELIFEAIDNKVGGVAYIGKSEVQVLPLNKMGWLFLGRTASGQTRIDQLVAKTQPIKWLYGGLYERTRDSLTYVQFLTGVGEELGSGPIRLIEEFPYNNYALEEESEIMVLQESGAVELGGNDLTFRGRPEDEFIGAVPSNLVVKDASISYGSKWLLSEEGLLYNSVASVLTDLHSGRYNNDPAFNGMKFRSLIPTFKADPDYSASVVLGVDESNTMWAFVDDARPKSYYDGDWTIDPSNHVGMKLELRNNVSGTFDMSLFQNFQGKRLKDCFVRSSDYFLSLLQKEDGTYVWHQYLISTDPYLEGTEYVEIEESNIGTFADVSMFADFKDAVYEYGGYDDNYNDRNFLIVASGTQLHGCNMTWNIDVPQASNLFYTADATIKSIKTRWTMDADYVSVGVLMEDGTFEVLQVKYDMDAQLFSCKSVYKENLKVLDPELEEVVDFIPKWGSGSNMSGGYCN